MAAGRRYERVTTWPLRLTFAACTSRVAPRSSIERSTSVIKAQELDISEMQRALANGWALPEAKERVGQNIDRRMRNRGARYVQYVLIKILQESVSP